MGIDYAATAGFGFKVSKDLARVILGVDMDQLDQDIHKYGFAQIVENCIDKFKETLTPAEKEVLSANYWSGLKFGYGTTGSAYSGKEDYYFLTNGKTMKDHLEGGKRILDWLRSLILCTEALTVEDLPFICDVHVW